MDVIYAHLSAEDFTNIRTDQEIGKLVYFVFSGSLFAYTQRDHETYKLCNFKGFNCAIKTAPKSMKCFEWVQFDLEEIPPFLNKDLEFELPDMEVIHTPCSSSTTVCIPVNSSGYTALEKFTFVYNPGNTDYVTVDWSRFSDPQPNLLGMTSPDDKWIYVGGGFKSFKRPSDFLLDEESIQGLEQELLLSIQGS